MNLAHANTEPMLIAERPWECVQDTISISSIIRTFSNRQCVETIQEEPKLTTTESKASTIELVILS